MNQAVPAKNKTRDIAIGLVGWALFHNLYFIGMVIIGQKIFSWYFLDNLSWIVFLWLPLVLVPLIVFARKRIWVGNGILAAIAINSATWLILLILGNSYLGWINLALPFPLCIFILGAA